MDTTRTREPVKIILPRKPLLCGSHVQGAIPQPESEDSLVCATVKTDEEIRPLEQKRRIYTDLHAYTYERSRPRAILLRGLGRLVNRVARYTVQTLRT